MPGFDIIGEKETKLTAGLQKERQSMEGKFLAEDDQYLENPRAGLSPEELYQVAGATASPRYVFPPLFFKKSSSFCIYVVLLSYHTKQSHIYKNCYA